MQNFLTKYKTPHEHYLPLAHIENAFKKVKKAVRTYIFPMELDNLLMCTKGAIYLRALKSLTTKRHLTMATS